MEDGTFIRVGSTNRQASIEMINELSRQQNNISYDSELVYSATVDQLDLSSFLEKIKEKTGENLTEIVLRKLELTKENQSQERPTNALILLFDSQRKRQLFPYAKIECARFKGTTPGNFIDQKTMNGPLGLQAKQAFQFVLRHISQETTGLYRSLTKRSLGVPN